MILNKNNSSDITALTPELIQFAKTVEDNSIIENDLFAKYEVKRGLRDLNGKGVLAGLTHISDVRANKIVDGVQIPTDGELFYRGYNVKDLVKGFSNENRFGFEEVTYLLLFDKLPTAEELESFRAILGEYRSLPTSFVREYGYDEHFGKKCFDSVFLRLSCR